MEKLTERAQTFLAGPFTGAIRRKRDIFSSSWSTAICFNCHSKKRKNVEFKSSWARPSRQEALFSAAAITRRCWRSMAASKGSFRLPQSKLLSLSQKKQYKKARHYRLKILKWRRPATNFKKSTRTSSHIATRRIPIFSASCWTISPFKAEAKSSSAKDCFTSDYIYFYP
jgi:hypothetical protein